MLNCIAGLLEINDGQIFINDQNVTWYEPSERGIGMVFSLMLSTLKCQLRVTSRLVLKNAKLSKDEIEERVEKCFRSSSD